MPEMKIDPARGSYTSNTFGGIHFVNRRQIYGELLPVPLLNRRNILGRAAYD